MPILLRVLDAFVLQISEDIGQAYNLEPFEEAFERYRSLLKASQERYRHHLSGSVIDIETLKVRFKYETAFLHVLTHLIEHHIFPKRSENDSQLPIHSSEMPFHWYTIPEDVSSRLALINTNGINIETDLESALGELIPAILSHAGKRYAGEYYTPQPIAKHLIDISGFIPQSLLGGQQLVDPACGGGVILTEVVRRFIEYATSYNVPPDVALSTLSHNLYGYDIQPFAIVLTRTLLTYTCLPLIRNNPGINYQQLFTNVKLLDPLAESEEFWKRETRFQYVIGNPPYFSAKREFLDFASDYDEVLSGHPNLYQLFLWWSVKSVSANGVVSFLLPQSILIGPYFKKLRQQLLLYTRIKSVTRMLDRKGIVGDADQQMLALSIQKLQERLKPSTETVEVRVTRNGNDIAGSTPQQITHSRIVRDIGNTVIWIVSDKVLDYTITERLERACAELHSLTNKFVIGNGEYVWNEQKGLLVTKAEEGAVPLISSSSIEPYRFLFPYTGSHPAATRQFSLKSEKVKSILHSGNAVLVQRTTPRKVGRRLVASAMSDAFVRRYDEYFLENHVLYIKASTISLAYGLSAWLNSDLINFVFQMRNGTAHTSISELSVLPVNLDILKSLASISKRITNSEKRDTADINYINTIIFDWLGLGVRHRKRIADVLNRTERGRTT